MAGTQLEHRHHPVGQAPITIAISAGWTAGVYVVDRGSRADPGLYR